MKQMSRGVAVGIAVLVIAWLAVGLLLGMVLIAVENTIGDYLLMGRMMPYSSAHLLEEAVEGTYSPSHDPLFFIGVLTGTGIPFAVASYVAARFHVRAPWFVVGVGLLGLGMVHRHVFRADFPSPVRLALFLELATAIVVAATAANVARLRANAVSRV
jgi:hypothetical protein